MSKKTLLLDASYQVISFITERKALKLLYKQKTEVISTWDDIIQWETGKIKHPSILRLKNHVKRNYFNSNFSRKALVKRDRSTCQYCGKKLTASQVTVDHVLPRAQGGITSFVNCVVCCQLCNNKKADRTPEQALMKLLKKPTHPSFSAHAYVADPQEYWHDDWSDYLR
jgi:uncharacterized protein with PIN domain